MPKQRITKEMIVDVAFEIVRKEGLPSLMVKNIASALNCSVQPIYSYCTNMEGLKQEVFLKTLSYVQEFMKSHINPNDFFRSTGLGYLKFAKEEPNLFHLFVLSERQNISSFDDFYAANTNPSLAHLIAKDLNISYEQAKELHLCMLIFNTGISMIQISSKPGIPEEELNHYLDKAYEAFLRKAIGENNENSNYL